MLKVSRAQAGDTIVEVLISMAIASSVLVGAYLATTRNVQSTQAAQERNQAIKLVQAQVEQLHAIGSLAGGMDCFNAGVAVTGTACMVDATGTSPAVGQPVYTLQITQSGSIYTVKATWDDVFGLTSNVTVFYGL